MPPKFLRGWRVLCLGLVLGGATLHAGEAKSPWLGVPRQQVIERLGEPRSVITAGSREILFFPRERMTLRDGVVIEVEPLTADSAPPPPRPVAPAPTATAPTDAAPDPSPAVTAPAPVVPQPAPVTPAVPEGERLEIKLVRPQGARPEPKETVAPAPAPVPVPVVTAPVEPPPPKVQPPRKPTAAELAAAAEAEEKKEKALASRRKLDEARLDEPTEGLFTGTSYILIGVLFASSVGYLLWKRQQRQITLGATEVEGAVAAPPSTSGRARFTVDHLTNLDAKRFEDLVAAYYNKTGVITERTNAGPTSAVQIRILWKGEPRPFAYVRCIVQPTGLIEVAPLQELVKALAAEDIRRGYVVTTGRFSVPARDLATEKHLTLLPADTFLEKLNALPDSARAEIMQEAALS